MLHIAGMKNKAADALSRHPCGKAEDVKSPPTEELSSLINTTTTGNHHFISGILSIEAVNTLTSFHAVTWDMVREATSSDQQMCDLLEHIQEGFPDSPRDLPPILRQYHRYRDELFVVDGVALYGDRIIVPPALRSTILDILHSAHQGVSSMLSRAESTVFWPGITPAVVERRERCNDCNRMAPSNPSAPPTPPALPTYPFQAVCGDYFKHCGKHYLVVVDRYSNWPIVERSSDGATGLVDLLKRTFMTFGIPDELSSDGGPEFIASHTQKFLENWGIHHRKSSVAFPHSNCRAEIGVKTVKRMITSNTSPSGKLNTDSFRIAMLQYRNTPDPETKISPAMCIFGRPIKDFIPILPGRYQPHPTWQDTLQKREEALRNRHVKAAERWSEHTKRLPPLRVGDTVRIQNQTGPQPRRWERTGTVVEVRQFDQYLVRVDGSRRVTLRNRKFLRRYIPAGPRQQPVTAERVTHKQPSPFVKPFTPVVTQHVDTPTPAPSVEADHPTAPTTPPPSPPGPQPATSTNVTPTVLPTQLPRTPTQPSRTASGKLPLCLRRLASHNNEGRKGLGEFVPDEQ